jgi:hypothetical protein
MTAERLAPLTGILAVGLIVAGFVVPGDPPELDAPLQEVVSWYQSHDSDVGTGGGLLALGGLFFLIFATRLRNFLRAAETGGAGASTLSFAGAIIFTVGVAIFAAIGITVGDTADDLDPAAIQVFHVMSENFFPPFATGLVAFMIGTGAAIIKTRVFPTWLGWLIAVAWVFAVTPLYPVAMVTLGLFILFASVALSQRAETT